MLSETELTDAAVPHLAELKDIRHIDIENTNITPAGAKKLENALPYAQIDHP